MAESIESGNQIKEMDSGGLSIFLFLIENSFYS